MVTGAPGPGKSPAGSSSHSSVPTIGRSTLGIARKMAPPSVRWNAPGSSPYPSIAIRPPPAGVMCGLGAISAERKDDPLVDDPGKRDSRLLPDRAVAAVAPHEKPGAEVVPRAAGGRHDELDVAVGLCERLNLVLPTDVDVVFGGPLGQDAFDVALVDRHPVHRVGVAQDVQRQRQRREVEAGERFRDPRSAEPVVQAAVVEQTYDLPTQAVGLVRLIRRG
jgi:hypothetical protein